MQASQSTLVNQIAFTFLKKIIKQVIAVQPEKSYVQGS